MSHSPTDSSSANVADDYICLNASESSSARLYHTLNALVVPRPIAFVTTINESGLVNAAPFSWFNAVCAEPPIVSVSLARRQNKHKDTTRNILDNGEFVVNSCSVGIASAISKAAGDWDSSISEIELTDLHVLASEEVKPPRVAECSIHLECRLHQHIEVGSGPVDLILGEVVRIHIAKDVLDAQGRVDVARLNPLARLQGDNYASLDPNFFSFPRG